MDQGDPPACARRRCASCWGASPPTLAPAPPGAGHAQRHRPCELTGGVWYPAGGIYQIAAAMQRLAIELGVEIRFRRAGGRDRRHGRAGHPAYHRGQRAHRRRGGRGQRRRRDRLRSPAAVGRRRARKPPAPGILLRLCAAAGRRGRASATGAPQHLFAQDYRAEFDDIFGAACRPTPTVYVAITSKSDPSHAPPGHENWFVLVNAPARLRFRLT